MDIKTERADGTLIAKAEGRIDGVNARDFEEAMKAAISGDDSVVVIDLRESVLHQQCGTSSHSAHRQDTTEAKRGAHAVLAVGSDSGGLRNQRLRQNHSGSRIPGAGALRGRQLDRASHRTAAPACHRHRVGFEKTRRDEPRSGTRTGRSGDLRQAVPGGERPSSVQGQSRSFTASRSSSSSARVASIFSLLNPSMSSPCTMRYAPPSMVTGKE